MKKYCKHIAVLFAITLSFLLTGCVNIQYARTKIEGGEITDVLTFTLDPAKLEKAGYSAKTLQDQIYNDIRYDYMIPFENKIDAIRQSDSEYYLIDDNIKINLTKPTSIKDGDYRVVVRTYYSSQQFLDLFENFKVATITPTSLEQDVVFSQFNSEAIENDKTKTTNESSYDITKDFLTIEYKQKVDNFFGDIREFQYGDSPIYYNEYKTDYNKFGLNDVSLTQIYGTTDDRLKSDADVYEEIKGLHFHLWNFSATQARDLSFSLYYIGPNATNWYLLAIGSTLILLPFIMLKAKISQLKAQAKQHELDNLDND